MSRCPWGRWEGDSLILRLRLTPRAAGDALLADAQQLRLRLTSAAFENRANRHAIDLLAKRFGVPRGRVRLVRGAKSRDKVFAIDAPARVPAELAGQMPPRDGE